MDPVTAASRLAINLRDVAVFGPKVLLRHFQQKASYINVSTRLGTFQIRPHDSDFAVLRQIFVSKEYDLDRFGHKDRINQAYAAIKSSGKQPLIIDAGANIGASSVWFAASFPDAVVAAIEPDPENAALCRTNCRNGNIRIFEAAIGSAAGNVTLNRVDSASWATTTARDENAATKIITVSDILTEYGPSAELFLVKIDIEGFESDLLWQNLEWLSQVQVLIIEPHDWLFPGKFTSKPLQKAIAAHDFEMLISGENLIYVR